MGKSYSEDLRLKALEALESGMTKMAVHRSFGISRSTLDDWLHLREQQGHVAPARHPGRIGQGFFDPVKFEAFARNHPEATLGQMRVCWEKEYGQLLNETTFSRWLRRIGWTRKKRVGFIKNATKSSVPTSRRG